MAVTTPESEGQSLLSAKAIGLGAYGPLVNDGRGFLSNPAGLTGVRDWDLLTGTYMNPLIQADGFIFQGVTLGKRFLERHAVAIQYSPGTSMSFVLPSVFTLTGANLPTSIDTRMRYDQPFSFGYASLVAYDLSIGISGKLLRERATDTKAQLNPDDPQRPFFITESTVSTSSWLFDVGVLWDVRPGLSLSTIGRNLVTINEGELPQNFMQFSLPRSIALDVGLAVAVTPSVRAAFEIGTTGQGALGVEWEPDLLTLRSGFYFSKNEVPFVYALGVGVGWHYSFLEFDLSYLRFLNQTKRTKAGSLQDFDAALIRAIDLNAYATDRVSVSVKAVLGNVRESLARIEAVEISGGIYPSSHQKLAYRPIGVARVRNIASRPIQARASFYLERLMDAPTFSPPVYLGPGEEKEIPLTAVFNEVIRDVRQMSIREGMVYVSATPTEDYDDRFQTRVLVYGRNDWDGEAQSLRYFITPDDPQVIRYTRDALSRFTDSLQSEPNARATFLKAAILLDTFAGKIVYVNDPKQSADFVQFPSETLQLRGGDCDDMTVCFSSLLNSIGISTAFVDVIPPGNPGKSHIYLMFDTGLEPRFGDMISHNPKRYIIRKNVRGEERIWIPIETTVIARGFDEAWSAGAQAYFDEVELGLGLGQGWVRIIDAY
jgi:hypothetical protein